MRDRVTRDVKEPGGAAVVDACPLCGSRSASLREEVPYQAIWKAFEIGLGASFSAAVMQRHTPSPDARLHECDRCGLQYFAPAVPGDAEFYRQLMSSTPYETQTWEFEEVASRTGLDESLVDFGCGDGAFLRQIAPNFRRTVGVDRNVEALGGLAAAGIEAHAEDFESFAQRQRERFDVACAFQLMEHLPRVDQLMAPMTECVRAGGRIFVSVPNRARYGRRVIEPMDCPPHHISRWQARQLEYLAARFGLELHAIDYEPLAYDGAVELVMSPLDRLLPVRPRALVRIVRSGFLRILIGPRRFRFAVRRGLFRRAGHDGHSILVELRRREGGPPA